MSDSANFDAQVYRSENPDLANLSEAELRSHFDTIGFAERRSFAALYDLHQKMSMRWLRGDGIEIGAGAYPTRLFGNARTVLADTDPKLKFGGTSVDVIFSLDQPNLEDLIGRDRFDFAIASHVLEHVDSLLRGLENLTRIVKPGGIIYVALPLKQYLHDKDWMPDFPFEHHVAEYSEPLSFAAHHDQLVSDEHFRRHGDRIQIHPANRFLYHKHNYDFQDWTKVLLRATEHLQLPIVLVDAAAGGARQDANFVFERTK
jgi:SAM-dependent methyltransferase